MFIALLNFIFICIFVYLILYAIYLLTINFKALFFSSKFLSDNSLKNKSNENFKKNKICVVIYANSKSKKLSNLLQALDEQTYDKELYFVHVVFAKNSNSLLFVPQGLMGAQIHTIENPEFFGKDKALNAFLEKIIPASNFDVYVFLGANNFVRKDYLETVNMELNELNAEVIVGKTTVVPEFKNHKLRAKVLEARQEFNNNTTLLSRRMFDLLSVIDSNNCVITQNILEKTGRVCFETKDDELKYSLFLASNGIKPIYSPFVEAVVEAENFNPTSAGASVRLSLFKYYFKFLLKKPWYFTEFVLSLLQPNVAVVFGLYFLLLYTSFRFISSIGIKYVFHLGIFYLLIWLTGFISSKLNPFKAFVFLLYPYYSFIFNFRKFTKDFSKKALQKTIMEEKNVKSATMDAFVTDGKKHVLCKMDLISEDGMRRVILRFRKKRIISNESIRMCDAVEDISKRVKSHGYCLKICQNCKNFKPLQDGTVDLLKGKCSINSEETGETFETLVWNTCNFFNPNEDNTPNG